MLATNFRVYNSMFPFCRTMKPKKKVAKKIPYWKNKRWTVCSSKKTSREFMNMKESKWSKYKPPSNGTQRLFFSAPARPYETSESEPESE